MSGRCAAFPMLLALTLTAGCAQEPPPSPIGMLAERTPAAAAPDRLPRPVSAAAWSFLDVTRAAGIDYRHHYEPTDTTYVLGFAAQQIDFAGGAASGDYDRDGDVDLYVVSADPAHNLLFRNRGDGTFDEVGDPAGVRLAGTHSAAPLFADLDGDGALDLVVGGIEETTLHLLRNRGDGTFAEATDGSGLEAERFVFSISAGDYDRDGDLDLAVGRWGCGTACEHLFRNDGAFRFVRVGRTIGVDGFGSGWQNRGDHSFTPNFVDMNDDGWPELLLTSDFTSQQYFKNDGGRFTPSRTDVMPGRNCMGAAFGDFDDDGRLDWFITGIYDATRQVPPPVGNRLFRSLGDHFEDVTDKAGVANGSWGWAACAQDFNNDGVLDILHVNGYGGPNNPLVDPYERWNVDPTRFFVGVGGGQFAERALAIGLRDTGMGRGLVCADFDGDGDLDVFIVNSEQPPELWRNELGADNHFLDVRLEDRAPNREGVGGRVYVTAGGRTQFRELRAGSNYASQDPTVAHFGLGASNRIDTLRVVWPDRTETVRTNVEADAHLVISHEPG